MSIRLIKSAGNLWWDKECIIVLFVLQFRQQEMRLRHKLTRETYGLSITTGSRIKTEISLVIIKEMPGIVYYTYI